MSMNLQQIRDFVRGHIDLDETDLPNGVLDVFIAEGFQRIVQAEKRWPFYVKRWSVNTANGVESFDLSTIDLKEVAAIVGPRWVLQWVGADTADWVWPRQSPGSGEPTHYAVENDTLYFHPTPSGTFALSVRGYRKPADWMAAGAGAVPDLPDEFHNTVAIWALAKAYNQQDDPEMGMVYERQFADEINLFRRRFNDTPAPQPLVMNGASRITAPIQALRYDWAF